MEEPPAYTPSAQRQELELHKLESGGTGLQIKRDGNVQYYVGHYTSANYPDLVLYGGYDSHGPRLAQAHFIQHSRDFKIFVGDQRTPSDGDWDIVRSSGGGLFSEPQKRFEIVGRKFYWQKTHESKLGSSRFSSADYKLVDQEGDKVVGVYIEGGGTRTRKGVLRLWEGLGEMVETGCLVVLLCLGERQRRHIRHKAFMGSPMSQDARR